VGGFCIKGKAMSNKTDLDWLARNVHAWVPNELLRMKPCDNGNGTFRASWCYSGDGGFTKDQWLARRAELQNKPSWRGAPEWAEWLAQDDSGEWYWYAAKPTHPGMKSWWPTPGDKNAQCGKGEVLGDWRDTLKKRPEEFKKFTSIEDNQGLSVSQEQEMKQDNGWFERGELPPVGTVCLYVVSDRLSAEVEITAHAKFGLCFVEVGKSGENYVSKTAELHRFRPVRTERDVLLSIIVEEMNRYDTDGKLADAILAAGFSLRDK